MTDNNVALRFPFTIFHTQHRMNDYRADDMYCGDLTESELTGRYGLKTISDNVDPWRSEWKNFPRSNYAVVQQKISQQELVNKLFTEFRRDSWIFTFFGYRDLFLDMVNHFQYGNGQPFRSSKLNFAYKRQIETDLSRDSSLKAIKEVLSKSINFDEKFYPSQERQSLTDAVLDTVLPKFTRWTDKINGLSMSVHDIYATKIVLESLKVDGEDFEANIHYASQDHFGLDAHDILNPTFHRLHIFRIWFVLQRWQQFGFKPFFTNMEANITLKGTKSENK
ncbi:DUF3289 family protein [Erwinia sp. 9145]|uniref:DUF3289 family protein n=1 Tax=Erwinia sp. 9145 TaxID=1500895 RepID=UPI0005579E1F|nr:DUF3289 family protein [Erwinia sp. 9145]